MKVSNSADNPVGTSLLRVGLIGMGFMGAAHLSAITRSEKGTLAAVSSRTPPGKAIGTAGNLSHVSSTVLPPNVPWFSNWQDLVNQPDIDAVDICAPSYLHKEMTIAALRAGKHVLCEKPMALTLEDCEAMVAASKIQTLMIAYVLRHSLAYQRAAAFVKECGEGQIKSCHFFRKSKYPDWAAWLTDEALSGGPILDLLSHDLDQALSLFGEPSSLGLEKSTTAGEIKALLRYPDGLEVRVSGGWLPGEVQFEAGFEVVSNHATLSFANNTLTLSCSSGQTVTQMGSEDMYLKQFDLFADRCQTKRAKPDHDLVAAVSAARTAIALRNMQWTSR